MGNNNGNAFTEYITNFNSGGNQHLGMVLNYDVCRDLTGTTYQASTEYTLKVAAGNRSGQTQATNDSQYAFAQGGVGTTLNLYGPNRTKNASVFTAGTFGEAPPLVMNTTSFPAAAGQTIRVLLRARGINHFRADSRQYLLLPVQRHQLRRRLKGIGQRFVYDVHSLSTGLPHSTTYYFRSTATNASGTAWAPESLSFTTVMVTPPSALVIRNPIGTTGYTALLNGCVVNPGNEAPDVTIYWGPADGGTTPGNWANSVTLSAQTGAFGHLANNLSPNTTYYWRAGSVNTNGTSWAPATITFTTNTKTPVVLNEIHYDPADHTKRVEFIELWNPSTTPVDISGWKITCPADFTFANATTIGANSYVVVAENPAILSANYTVGGTLLGPRAGVLPNGSGRVVLRDAAYTQVDDADYRQGFPWPTMAAGGGASAELINPALENDVGGHGAVPVRCQPLAISTRSIPM